MLKSVTSIIRAHPALTVGAIALASCSGDANRKAPLRADASPTTSPSVSYSSLICTMPDSFKIVGTSLAVKFPVTIEQPMTIENTLEQFNASDTLKIKAFYKRYEEFSRDLPKIWLKEDRAAQQREFDHSIDMLRDWGESNVRQNFCGSCAISSPLRRLIAQLPLVIALRLVRDSNNTVQFTSNVQTYLSTAANVNNIGRPVDPNPALKREYYEVFPDVLSSDANRALMIYQIIKGDIRAAEKLWPRYNLSVLREAGNKYNPMADDVSGFIERMKQEARAPGQIVSDKALTPGSEKTCSAVYMNYLEYLSLLRNYSPIRDIRDRYVRIASRDFIRSADQRLLSSTEQKYAVALSKSIFSDR